MAIFLIAAQIAHVFPLPTTAPAFLWIPHDYGYLSDLITWQIVWVLFFGLTIYALSLFK
jgi:hypothetical protein